MNSFFAHLAPLQLTASGLNSLVNKQLIPTMAYRLMAGPITDAQFVKLQHLISNNIAVFGKLPRWLSAKDRHHSRSSPCFGLGLMPFRTFMHTQVHNYSIRYLNSEGPTQSNYWVCRALTNKRANWLQNSFVDSVQALGGHCHGFKPWNACKVADLHPGETVYVEFNSGWHGRTVLHDPAPNYAVVQFHIDNTLFHIKDALHNFSVHLPPQPNSANPEPALNMSISPPLLYLQPPIPPYAIPYRSTQVGSNWFGHLFRYPEEIPLPQVSALVSWGCVSVRNAVEHPQANNWLWVYLDGSWDNPLAASAAVMVWPDGTVLALAIPCPYLGSKDAEFWSFVQCTRYLQSVGLKVQEFFCIDNSQLVDCTDWALFQSPIPPASASTQETWFHTVHGVIRSSSFTVGVGWLKSHVGFQGNQVVDGFAKYTSYACAVLEAHKQPPGLHTVTFHGNPHIHKLGGSQRRRLYPRHANTGISLPLSFDWARHHSWFSSFAAKWVLGVKGIHRAGPFWDVSDRQCPLCDTRHPLDVVSSVAFCDDMKPFLHQLADSWGPNISPVVHQWLTGPRSRGELRTFARTLTPVSLFELLTASRELKHQVYESLPTRRKALASTIKSACKHRRDRPLPEPLPPPPVPQQLP